MALLLMPSLPPFEQRGEKGEPFYALAYCQGAYGVRPRSEDKPVFLTIYFTTSPGLTHFSHHIVDASGRCFAYFRGDDGFDRPEFALLRAWAEFQVPPAAWRLFPQSEIRPDTFPQESENRAAYCSARSCLCRLFWRFRVLKHFSPPPLFCPASSFAPPSITEESDENREISQAIEQAKGARE
jgi:hypothetical protein